MIHNYNDNHMWEFIAIYIHVFYNNFFFFFSLYFLNILVQIGFLSSIWFGLSRILGMTMASTIWMYPILYFLFNLL